MRSSGSWSSTLISISDSIPKKGADAPDFGIWLDSYFRFLRFTAIICNSIIPRAKLFYNRSTKDFCGFPQKSEIGIKPYSEIGCVCTFFRNRIRCRNRGRAPAARTPHRSLLPVLQALIRSTTEAAPHRFPDTSSFP